MPFLEVEVEETVDDDAADALWWPSVPAGICPF